MLSELALHTVAKNFSCSCRYDGLFSNAKQLTFATLCFGDVDVDDKVCGSGTILMWIPTFENSGHVSYGVTNTNDF